MPPTPPCIKPDWPAPANVLALSTTREGGHSSAPFSSLNLGHHVGDEPAAIERNRGLLAQLLPTGSRVQWLQQVHGTRVVEAGIADRYPEADASWSREAGQACAVLTADCLPVLFCSLGGDAVAAAHAGWRGLLDGVLESTVAALGVVPDQLMAWLGPAIGPAAFEVGPEVREAFSAALSAAPAAGVDACFVPSATRRGHFLADLYGLARLRLAGLGITRVYGGGLCTFSDPQRFYSYRRDGQTGRMASLVSLRVPEAPL